MEIGRGFCQCGCGKKTNINKQTNNARGHKRGEHSFFISGHNSRGKNNGNWKGGVVIWNGYILRKAPTHPRAYRGYVTESVLVVEKALGKCLPLSATVHHINGIITDNRPKNLIVCQNNAYHQLLHARQRAYKASGDPNKRKCKYCKKYDSIERLIKYRGNFYHKECHNKYHQKYDQIRRERLKIAKQQQTIRARLL